MAPEEEAMVAFSSLMLVDESVNGFLLKERNGS
jgi:hypothetical protein